MAVTQSSYNERSAFGVPGQVANTEASNIISRTVESATGLTFGHPAFRGAGDNGAKVYEASAKFLGVTVMSPGVKADADNPDRYQHQATANILTQGAIYVRAGESVAQGDPVYWSTSAGKFVKTATGNVAIPDAVFDASGSDNDIVRIVIKLR